MQKRKHENVDSRDRVKSKKKRNRFKIRSFTYKNVCNSNQYI
jgi:hypothetical protein